MLSACIGRCGGALSPTGCPFRARAASNDRPRDNYCHIASFSKGQCVGLCAFVQLLLWIRSVPVSNPCARRTTARPRNVTSVGVQSPLLGLLGYVFPFRTTRLQQQTWTALVDSLPLAKTDAQKLQMTLELRENSGQQHSRQRNAGMHSHECAQVMVKLRRRHCLGCVAAMCNKIR